MPMYLGDKAVAAAYLGDKAISKAFVGASDAGGGGPVSSKIALGSKLGFIGDSILNYNHVSANGVNQIRSLSRGELTYAKMRSPRWRDDTWHDDADANGRFFTGANHGVSGDTTTGVLARLNALIAMAPAIAVVAIGTNNLSPTATAISEIQQICEQLLAANIKVLLCTVRPWSTAKSGDNAGSRANRVTVNNGIRAYAATKNTNSLRLCDLDLVYDPDNDGYGPVSWFVDGLHPIDLGASNAGAYIQAVLNDWFETGNWLTANFWDSGNLQTNPTLTGAGGGMGAGVTGVVPTSWRVQRGGTVASTCVASVEANVDTGGQSAVLDITPVGSAISERFEFQIGSVGQVNTMALDGQWAMAWAELEYDDKTWWGCPQLQLFHGSDGTQFASGGYNSLSPINMAPVNGKLWVSTPPILMPAGITSYKFILQMRFNAADGVAAGNGPGRVKVRRGWAGAISNPKSVWNT